MSKPLLDDLSKISLPGSGSSSGASLGADGVNELIRNDFWEQYMKPALFLCVTFLLAACARIPVTTDYEVNWDFSTINSYAWLEPQQKIIVDPLVDNELMSKRIRRSVETQLNARGMVKTAVSSNPDVLISYHVSTKERMDVHTYFNHFGYHPYFGHSYFGRAGFGHSDITVQQYTAGSFVIDIIDPETKQLVWQGVSERRLNQQGTPKQKDHYVDETIRAILDKFPPTPAELAQR